MRYVSIFSGIEAASCAVTGWGWEAVAFAEIDPFACAVLAHHFPDVPNLGDVTKIDWSPYRGAVDVLVGGSPCQSFSVAGDRSGLSGASGLMLEYIRAVREVMPRAFVWENVPGCLSSGPKGEKGSDFGCLLRELAQLRGPGGERYGLAWRVLDSQFFGVAQRRRRVFVVGRLGADGGGAAEILFEREGVPWNPEPSAKKREALAADARGRAQLGHRERERERE